MSPAAIHPMIVDFRLLEGTEDLHTFLGCDEALSRALLDAPDEVLFSRHAIPKPNGRGTREVWAVKTDRIGDVYKALARKLDAFIRERWSTFPHAAAHGYLKGRSTLTNARAHVGARAVLNADIKRFFRSIGRQKVVASLVELGLSDEAARAVAKVVVRAGHLPLGLHTSPLLANVICTHLDKRLALLVPGGRYTRYADDLSFSGPALPSRGAIEAELAKDGFELAPDKWRLARAGRGLYVTGLSIEDGRTPRVPKEMKRRLRQDLFYCKRWGLVEHVGRRGYGDVQSGVNRIDGLIRYIQGIEQEVGRTLNKSWRGILATEGVDVSYPRRPDASPRRILFVVDESVIAGTAGDVMLVALVVVEDMAVVRKALAAFLKKLRSDPYGATDKTTLFRKGLHWNELAQDDRSELTKRVRALPFRAFVASAPLPKQDKASYRETYVTLLSKLVQGRLIRYDRCSIDVVAEENSKITLNSISAATLGAYESLATRGSRRPESAPAVQQCAKGGDAALPLADIVLGILGDYATSAMKASKELSGKKKRVSGTQAETRFEQVRDKVRAIFDLETGDVFSRKRPFKPWKASIAPVE